MLASNQAPRETRPGRDFGLKIPSREFGYCCKSLLMYCILYSAYMAHVNTIPSKLSSPRGLLGLRLILYVTHKLLLLYNVWVFPNKTKSFTACKGMMYKCRT